MRPGSQASMRKRATPEGGADPFGVLPDELLQHLLSYLPPKDAVRTSVLAHRWRNQWKYVPAIRITADHAQNFGCASTLNKFTNCLLLFRNGSPLDEFEINAFEGDADFNESVQYLEPWIRYCLSLNVRKLSASSNDEGLHWLLPEGLITSKHLTMLELARVDVEHDLDFSSCMALEILKIKHSNISSSKIISTSLKRLTIVVCGFEDDARCQISVPNLISFLFVDCTGRTPLLESMPLLVSTFVRLQHCADYCRNSYETGDCGDASCAGCLDCNYGKGTSLLLEGLSGSTKLELMALPEVFIFRKDLTRCPVFNKLKTLLLNEWCMTPSALICFLQHSPVLEKLTLQFSEVNVSLVESGASYGLHAIVKQPLGFKDLTVEVKCHEVNEGICKILEVLCSYGLPPEKIKIQQPPVATREQFHDTWD
ncbi:hypothetical protein ACP70R_007621 [Stipagrostis hirtigluma subsp. patula]